MPVGLRQMAWVHASDQDFPLLVMFKCLALAAPIYVRLDLHGLYLRKTVCKDVRLLYSSFCVFSEH